MVYGANKATHGQLLHYIDIEDAMSANMLKSKLIDVIRFKGPLTVADYMKIVLTNPESGFYMNDHVFGVKGHFTTSPEISQTFGEILGAWIMQEWRRFGCLKPLRLVEFGPGRGTLMSDITRTITQLDSMQTNDDKSIQINLIEVSPKLQEVQQQTLAKQSKQLVERTKWFTHIDALPKDGENEPETGFTAYIAHEYLDALPVYKFVRDPKTNSWRDLTIDYDEKENLRFCIASQPSLQSRLLVPEKFSGDHIEVCADAALQLEKVTKRLNATQKGCMLVCDYGFEDEPESDSEEGNRKIKALKPIRASRDTFRAFKDHEPWPPLKDPGTADLTADVDFGYLKRHLADKALLFGTVDQRSFLLKCGLQARLKVLLENCKSEESRNDLISGANMMLQSMGQRYRFLALFPKGTDHLFVHDPPAGFCDTW